jgi:hypothetical protein
MNLWKFRQFQQLKKKKKLCQTRQGTCQGTTVVTFIIHDENIWISLKSIFKILMPFKK